MSKSEFVLECDGCGVELGFSVEDLKEKVVYCAECNEDETDEEEEGKDT